MKITYQQTTCGAPKKLLKIIDINEQELKEDCEIRLDDNIMSYKQAIGKEFTFVRLPSEIIL